MTPFFFGPSERPLYGVYHAARAVEDGPRPPAALLIPPFGEEANRSARLFRLLAERLARQGGPALRFDLSSSGDSAGACDDASLETWFEDVRVADQELRDMSGAPRVVWIGLRLGAALALKAAAQAKPAPAGLLLWDPVVDGPRYLEELEAAHVTFMTGALGRPTEAARAAVPKIDGVLAEASGAAIGPALRAELPALNALTVEKRPSRRALVLTDGHADANAQATALETALAAAGTKAALETVADAAAWNSDDAMNAFVTPHATMERITTAMAGWR